MYNEVYENERFVAFMYDLFYVTIIVIFILVAMSLYAAIKKRLPKRIRKYSQSSILLSRVADPKLINGHSGMTPSGMPFIYLISHLALSSRDDVKGLYSIELPFRSGAHLLGSPVRYDSDYASTGMRELTLEGDYPNYFHLYAAPDQDTHGRYVLDPKAMLFTVEFCQNFQWEIVDDTLHFMSNDKLPSMALVDEFVSQIRPAIEIPSDRQKNPANLPYSGQINRTVRCPICDIALEVDNQYLRCPDGHGLLVTGKQLIDLRQRASDDGTLPLLSTDAIDHASQHSKRRLTCPYCSHRMKRAKYQHTGAVLDVCSKCMYRWIDSVELVKVAGETGDSTS